MKSQAAVGPAPDNRPTLTVIQSTHVSMEGFRSTGLFGRHVRLLREYARSFNVVVYSCDTVDYSTELGVRHVRVPWLPRRAGWRHGFYFLWLVWRAPRMRGVIKVFGSNICTLPAIRRISRRPMMVTYQWDYAEGIRMDMRGPRRWLAPFLERQALRPADLVLATAPWLEEKVRRVYRRPTILLPNWVDVRELLAAPRGHPRSATAVLYAGRLHRIKGLDGLLDAFADVQKHVPAAALTLCGAGEEEAHLRDKATSLGLASVQLRGAIPQHEVLALMASCTVFVLPTLTMEGHPKALVEAMACGCACVATNVPGNRELVTDGETGLLVPPGDAAALARAIVALLSDEPLRGRLTAAAKEAVAACDFDRVVPKEVEALLALAQAGRRAN